MRGNEISCERGTDRELSDDVTDDLPSWTAIVANELVVGFVIRLVTPFVDERRGDNANADEHGEVNPLLISYSCCAVHRYEAEYDEDCCNLGFCADQAIRLCGGLF